MSAGKRERLREEADLMEVELALAERQAGANNDEDEFRPEETTSSPE